MAESVSRRDALQKAWPEKTEGYAHPISPNYESGFSEGFDAAWEMLMADIRPLVANLRTNKQWDQCTMTEVVNNDMAIKRLRALVREGE
jgi:hypothetical protein